MPTTIWLARHAQTAVPGVFHGAEDDIGLSDLGHAQAEAAAGWFAQLKPTAVISSAMLRARDTAAPIARACGLAHEIVPEIHERSVGAMCGTSYDDATSPWPETVRRWTLGETAYTSTGAESFDDLRARLVPPLERIAEKHRDARVVVIAHGVVCKVLLLSLLPRHTPRDWVRLGHALNLSVSELIRDEVGWTSKSILQVPEPVAKFSGAG